MNELVSNVSERDSPGLTAGVYYLRPFDRDRLLPALAKLGVFVQERRWEDPGGDGRLRGVDLTIVFARLSDMAALRALCRQSPVVLAVVDSSDAVAPSLDAGATLCALDHDLLRVPSEVLAEAARTARRTRSHRSPRIDAGSSPTVELGGAQFSSQACALACGSARVALSRAERDVLSRLAADPGVPVTSEALASAAQIRMFPTSRYLASVIVSLRRKLRRLGADAGVLATVHGVGYVLLAPERSKEAGP